MAALDDLEEIARAVVDCGYQLHRELGPGLLESAYEALMAASLRHPDFALPVRLRSP